MDTTHADRPKRCGIYCRLSYAPDGSLEKVDRQESDCRDLGQRLGWPISERHIYVDNSRSAWQRNRRRAQWDQMLRDVDTGEIDGLLIYHGDRLIRQPYDLELLLGVADTKGVRLASPSGTRNLDSPDDRFILRIEAAQACRESDNISRRVARAQRAAVAQGRTTNGGKRPFGYGVSAGTRTRVDRKTGVETTVPAWDTTQLNPDEAPYIADAAERLLAGQGQASIVAWMRAEGVRTTEGGEMTTRGLRHLLLAPRVAGLIRYEGNLYQASWPGILDRETWDAVCAYYRRSAGIHPYPGRARRHLLSGVATCYACHQPVGTKPTGGRNRTDSRIYHCGRPGCRAVGRSQLHLDAYVEGRTLRLLQDPAFVRELVIMDDQPGVAAEIVAVERRRDETQRQLDALADHPDVDVTAALLGMASFERRLADLRSQVATTSRQRLLLRMAGISREQWMAEPVDVRSATVAALWRVVILPATHRGPGFSPASVRMERRSEMESPTRQSAGQAHRLLGSTSNCT